MRKTMLGLLAAMVMATAHAGEGTVTVASAHDVATTADRLVAALEGKGMTVFQRIDHAEGAAGVEMALRPTELVIFGNPRAGTPLMQCGQSVAIDLPQKALIWEDEAGDVQLAYNDPQYLADRHDIGNCGEVIGNIARALASFAEAATAP